MSDEKKETSVKGFLGGVDIIEVLPTQLKFLLCPYVLAA